MLSTVFEKQLEKIEVLRNEILKIQQLMDVSLDNLLPIQLTTLISTGTC